MMAGLGQCRLGVMTDRVDAETRSRVMSRIRKKWSQIDRLAHNVLKAAKVRHSMYPKLAGSPDVLVHPDLLIFLDGCFWHCCPRCFRPPSSRRSYWLPKLAGNRRRDAKLSRLLKRNGWKVVRIWEHEIRARPHVIVDRLCEAGFQAPGAKLVGGGAEAAGQVSTRRQSHSPRSRMPRLRRSPRAGI